MGYLVHIGFLAIFFVAVLGQFDNDFGGGFEEKKPIEPKPDIYSLRIESEIKHRYATTKVMSIIANRANVSQEVFFDMVLPQSAFITSFVMEIGGKEYKAYLKEKDEAKKTYDQAVSSGFTAAHVEVTARDSNQFRISVNVEKSGKVKFTLHYEELLKRTLGVYNHVINLNPRQPVRDLQVDVIITESSNITHLFVPAIRTSNEITDNEPENDVVKITRKPNKAHIVYKPTLADQEKLSKHEYGGQLVVQYDLDRNSSQGSKILLNDGYFVHFFSPSDLQPLRKYAIFVLDLSGSMIGRKLVQLKEAMQTILNDLGPNDYFNIIDFSYTVKVHNFDLPAESAVIPPDSSVHSWWTPPEAEQPERKFEIPQAYPATQEYVGKAKEAIERMVAAGGTNIHDALKNAIFVAQSGIQGIKKKENITDNSKGNVIEPIIIFLTDGEPTVGISDPKKIVSMVKEFNHPKTSIFSLGFGSGADMGFLRRVSLSSSAFARSIYEAADASLQLKNFYKQISSPLLSNVSFAYVPSQITKGSITKEHFPSLFLGSEIIVAGKIADAGTEFDPKVKALSTAGETIFEGEVFHDVIDKEEDLFIPGNFSDRDIPTEKKHHVKPRNTLERLWAYLTIQQLIDRHDDLAEGNSTEKDNIKKEAVELAMKYQFVTPFTSLVVVKPNKSEDVTDESLKPSNNPYGGPGQGFALGVPAASGAGGFAHKSSVDYFTAPIYPPGLGGVADMHFSVLPKKPGITLRTSYPSARIRPMAALGGAFHLVRMPPPPRATGINFAKTGYFASPLAAPTYSSISLTTALSFPGAPSSPAAPSMMQSGVGGGYGYQPGGYQSAVASSMSMPISSFGHAASSGSGESNKFSEDWGEKHSLAIPKRPTSDSKPIAQLMSLQWPKGQSPDTFKVADSYYPRQVHESAHGQTTFGEKMEAEEESQSTTESQELTTVTSDEAPIDKLLEIVSWLNKVYNKGNNSISLPTGDKNSTEEYHLANIPSNSTFQPCQIEKPYDGTCKHFIDCIMPELTESVEKYLKFFCPITGGFAGICCPSSFDSIPPVSEANPPAGNAP